LARAQSAIPVLVFDTSFLIEFEAEVAARRQGDAFALLNAHRNQLTAVSVVSFGEFAEGFANIQQAEAFLIRFRVLNLSRLIAFRMAALQSSLPQRLGENDAWITATALYYGCKLVGRENAFRRVPNLKYVEF
jgi:hypothetical protein